MVSFRLRLARQYYSPGNLQLADLLDPLPICLTASAGRGGRLLGVGASRVVDARVRVGHGRRGRVVERRGHVGGQAGCGRRAGHRRVVAERRLHHGVMVVDQQTLAVVGAHVLQVLKVDWVGNERFAGAASTAATAGATGDVGRLLGYSGAGRGGRVGVVERRGARGDGTGRLSTDGGRGVVGHRGLVEQREVRLVGLVEGALAVLAAHEAPVFGDQRDDLFWKVMVSVSECAVQQASAQ